MRLLDDLAGIRSGSAEFGQFDHFAYSEIIPCVGMPLIFTPEYIIAVAVAFIVTLVAKRADFPGACCGCWPL